MSTWILLATSAKSIIFSLDRGKYTIVKKFFNETATTRLGELTSDRQTLVRSPATAAASMPENHYQEDMARRFGNEIVAFLDKGLHQRKFGPLIVVSSKQFAGDLRSNFSTTLAKNLQHEILKNFYTENAQELHSFLDSHLYKQAS